MPKIDEDIVTGNRPAGGGNLGGILHFPLALQQHPDLCIVFYSRVSSWGQAGPQKEKLWDKTVEPVTDILRLAPGKLRFSLRAVESGKLSRPRKGLIRACEEARKRGGMVVAPDLSRLIRAESFCHRTNLDAWPTPEEFAMLREMTGGVLLATLADPTISERERRSIATKRTGKAGRPRSIDDEMAADIFAFLDFFCWDWSGRPRWGERLADVADIFGVSKAAILRASERVSPSGKTWRDEAIDKAEKLGLLKRGKNGEIVLLMKRWI
jgi:hypothetical protein